uniref:Uncharacterized protein n=1 Tax=Opuntia streptacantha TaxID=393608 RepID=A0A7C9CZ34_OPUST
MKIGYLHWSLLHLRLIPLSTKLKAPQPPAMADPPLRPPMIISLWAGKTSLMTEMVTPFGRILSTKTLSWRLIYISSCMARATLCIRSKRKRFYCFIYFFCKSN